MDTPETQGKPQSNAALAPANGSAAVAGDTTKHVEPQVKPEYFAIMMVFACGVMLSYDAPILRAVLWGGGFGFGLAVLMLTRRKPPNGPDQLSGDSNQKPK